MTFQDGLIDMLERNAKKGRLVHAEGKLQTRRWSKPGEDSDRFSTEILVVPGAKLRRVADRRHQSGRRHRPDARDLHQPSTCGHPPDHFLDPRIERPHAFVQPPQLVAQPPQQRATLAWELVLRVLKHLRQPRQQRVPSGDSIPYSSRNPWIWLDCAVRLRTAI